MSHSLMVELGQELHFRTNMFGILLICQILLLIGYVHLIWKTWRLNNAQAKDKRRIKECQGKEEQNQDLKIDSTRLRNPKVIIGSFIDGNFASINRAFKKRNKVPKDSRRIAMEWNNNLIFILSSPNVWVTGVYL